MKICLTAALLVTMAAPASGETPIYLRATNDALSVQFAHRECEYLKHRLAIPALDPKLRDRRGGFSMTRPNTIILGIAY